MATLRTTLPGWAWALLTWLVVVAAASTFGWLAISRAGDRVLASPVAPLPASADQEAGDGASAGSQGQEPGRDAGVPSTTAADGGASGEPVTGGAATSDSGSATAGSAGPQPPAGGTAGAAAPSARPQGAAGGAAAPTGQRPPQGAGPAPTPSATPVSPRPSAAAPPPAAPADPAPTAAPPQRAVTAPVRVDASAVVTGGQVRVTCTGDAIELNGATPSNGWAMERDVRGTREVRVEFRSDEVGTSKVRATCVAGVPALDVQDAGD